MDFLKELKFFTDAIELGASDLHVSSGEVPMMRIHGVLEKTEYSPLTAEEVDEIIKRLTTSYQKDSFTEKFHGNWISVLMCRNWQDSEPIYSDKTKEILLL